MTAASRALILVSHALCPYVQRVAIVLIEKGLDFERRDIDLAAKPAWFLALSPLGKTPLLQVNRPDGAFEAIFESAVICEYLEDVSAPELALHPSDALQRAHHRAWMELASALLSQIAAVYRAADADSLRSRVAELDQRLTQIEAELDAVGPYFSGPRFALPDAAFAPAFHYFPALQRAGLVDTSLLFHERPRLHAWCRALATRPSVMAARAPDHELRLADFLSRQPSARVAPGQLEPSRIL